MLFIAEGRINRAVQAAEHTVAAAWLGPMVDSGFLQSGYLDETGRRVFMVLRRRTTPRSRSGSVACRSCAKEP